MYIYLYEVHCDLMRVVLR